MIHFSPIGFRLLHVSFDRSECCLSLTEFALLDLSSARHLWKPPV